MTQYGDHTGVEKLQLSSKDWTSDHVAKIAELFPQVITESQDKHGRLRKAIDFDKLKDILSFDLAEGRETYEFTWVGKRDAMAEAGRPTTKTLRPDLAESVNFDETENVFITGDNLEVLKILQESYLNKIDMIYIDPPYNTGKDFVYSDKFRQTMSDYEIAIDLRDEEGRQRQGLKPNLRFSGSYHSDWLTMMYPRLTLARNLLKDTGVIFISIDDNEQANLKVLCDEVFGEENFRNNLLVRRRTKSLNLQFSEAGLKTFNVGAEHILVYSKSNKALFNPIEKKKEVTSSKGVWNVFWSNADRPSMRYSLLDFTPETGQWRWSEEKAKIAVANYETFLNKYSHKMSLEEYSQKFPNLRFIRKIDNGTGKNGGVQYYVPPKNTSLRTSNWTDIEVSQIAKDFDLPFENPKNISLIMEIIKSKTSKNDLILDLFAGSATTADAIMRLNASDDGKRKYILCTIDEKVTEKSTAKEAGYDTIDQISRERIRRAADKIRTENPEKAQNLDFGFKAFKLDSSNFKEVYQSPEQYQQVNLLDNISNIKEERNDLDLLFQVMLSWGMELSLSVKKEQLTQSVIYNVAENALIACFAEDITEDVIRQIAQKEPLRAVFKDSSFANSSDKINLSQIFKEVSPMTKVKVV